jgi:hypothetical protein
MGLAIAYLALSIALALEWVWLLRLKKAELSKGTIEATPDVVRKKALGDLAMALGVGFLGSPLILALPFVSPFGSLTEAADCGRGHHMGVVTSPGAKGGTSYSLACLDDPDRVLLSHWLVTLTLYVVLTVGAWIAYRYYKAYQRSLEGPVR